MTATLAIRQTEVDSSEGTARRGARWTTRDRARLGGLQPLKRVNDCGAPIGAFVGITAALDGVHVTGVSTCGSVHSCPVCAPKIRQSRAAELSEAIARWQAEGGECFLVTLTAEHHQGERLSAVLADLSFSWGKMTSGRNKAELDALGRSWGDDGAKLGYVRGVDLTHGRNGWHPHYHAVFFCAPGVTRRRVERTVFPMWRKVTGSVNRRAVANACDVTRIHPTPEGRDASVVAMYALKAGCEVFRIDNKRAGSGLSPWQLLGLAINGHEPSAALWAEYSTVMQGKHAGQWSRRLREWFGRDEQTDDELAEGTLVDRVDLAYIRASDYRQLRRIAGASEGILRVAMLPGGLASLFDQLRMPIWWEKPDS